MEETWEHVSVHWQQGNYQLWVNCFMCWNKVAITGLSLKATPPPAIMASVLTTRPWPVRQKRTGTSRMVSQTRHNNEPTLSRNDSPPGCLHLALAYRYYFYMEETWEHVSVHWQQGNYQLWANCFMCWNQGAIAGFRVSRQPRHPLLYRVS